MVIISNLPLLRKLQNDNLAMLKQYIFGHRSLSAVRIIRQTQPGAFLHFSGNKLANGNTTMAVVCICISLVRLKQKYPLKRRIFILT